MKQIINEDNFYIPCWTWNVQKFFEKDELVILNKREEDFFWSVSSVKGSTAQNIYCSNKCHASMNSFNWNSCFRTHVDYINLKILIFYHFAIKKFLWSSPSIAVFQYIIRLKTDIHFHFLFWIIKSRLQFFNIVFAMNRICVSSRTFKDHHFKKLIRHK